MSTVVFPEVYQLRFRLNERFAYEYDFCALWRHEIRLEQIVPFDPVQTYPVCTSGARAAPAEDCGGPQAFLALRQHFSIFHMAERLVAVLQLETLRYWLTVDRFDRRALNQQLRQDAKTTAISEVSSEVSV